MYLQAVTPHPSAISTQLCQFFSWPPCPPSPVCRLSRPSLLLWDWNLIMDERDIEAVQHREDEEDHDDASLNHTTMKEERENVWDNLSIAVSAPNICVSISTTTRKTFKPRKTWNFEASENWAPLTDVVWTETSKTNLTKITFSFGLYAKRTSQKLENNRTHDVTIKWIQMTR